MAASIDQCAVAADGSLLDASQIVFFDDPDDDKPLSNINPASSSNNLHCRSGRVTRPSARITDPNNIEASVSRKRSATVTTSTEASVRAARRAKLTSCDDESEQDDEMDNAEVNTGDDDADAGAGDGMTEEEVVDDSSDVEHAQEAYRTTKAMGDADRRVCLN
jgi:hypothetical protein